MIKHLSKNYSKSYKNDTNHASFRMRDQKYYHRICSLNQFSRNTSNTKA